MAGEYLTTGQAARVLGVSKGTILNAVEAGELRATYRMPGGAYRFQAPDVERYAQWRVVRHQVEEQTRAAVRTRAQQAAAVAGASMESLVEQPATATTEGDASTEVGDTLALLADSLQVGATLVARNEGGSWPVVYAYDRAGMGVRAGAPLPWSEVFAVALGGGPMASLIVEDVRTDARLTSRGDLPHWGVGTVTAVPLHRAGGQMYGALCTLHPSPRAVPGGELSMLRLAGRMVVQAVEASALRERERRAALRASQLAAIVEQSDDAIFRMSSSGVIETWNAGAARLFGYTADEAIGQGIAMLAPADRADEQPSMLRQLMRGQDVADLETVRLRKDGSAVRVSLTISGMRDAAGGLIGGSAIARDISDRARAHQATEELARLHREQAEEAEAVAAVGAALSGSLELHEVYAQILDQAHRLLPYDVAGVVQYEGEWAVIAASAGSLPARAGTRYYRRPESHHLWRVGTGATTYVPDTVQEPGWQGIEPAVAALGLRSVVHVPLVLGGGPAGSLAVASLRPNAYTERQIRMAVRLGEYASRALGSAQLYASEQARARAAEELVRQRDASADALRTLSMAIEQNPASVIITDPAERIEYVNPKFCHLTGYGAAEVVGRNARDVWSDLNMQDAYSSLLQAATAGDSWTGMLRVEGVDGDTRWERVSLSPIRDAGGTVSHFVVVAENVTDRQQAEVALQQSEALFRSLYEHTPVGVALVGLDGRCLMVNASLQRILGYEEAELQGKHFTEYAHADDAAADEQLFAEVVAGTRDAYALEKRYIRKDGQTVWGQLGVSVARDQGGVPRRVVLTLLDLSERHAAEQRLRQSEEHYRQIVETAMEGIFQSDAEDRMVFGNQRAADIIGYSPEELLGMPAATLSDAEDQKAYAARAAARQAGTLRATQFERTVRRKDGTLRWVQVSLVPQFDAQGRYAGMFGMVTDIHQRKQAEQALRRSEERYRRIIETAQEGVWQLDFEGRTTFCNQRLCEMLGYGAREILGRHPWAFVPEDGVSAALERQRKRECGVYETAEILFRRKDGSTFWTRAQSFPLFDEQGRTVGSIGMLVDITERRAADQARARLAAIVQSFPDAIIGTSATSLIESWNEGAERLYGYTAEEVIGRHAAMLAPPELQGEVDGIARQIAEGRPVVQLETVRRHKNGQRLDVLLSVSPIRDTTGAVIGNAGITYDLRERKLAEAAVRESEHRYRLLFENALAGLELYQVVFDPQGVPVDFRFLEVNPGFERMTGLPAAAVLGRTVLEVDLHADASWLESCGRVALTGEPEIFQSHDRGLDRHFDVFAYRPAAGRLAVVFTDNTERIRAEMALRESEQEFRVLAENSSDMIVRLRANMLVLYVSPAARQVIGFDPRDLVGRRGLDFVHPDDVDTLRTVLAEVLRGSLVEAVSYRHLRPDGSYVWLESTGRAVRDAATGEVTELQVASRDITERKRTEKALREVARERSEEAAIAEALVEASAALASVMEPEPLYARILEQMARVVPCSGACIFAYRPDRAVVVGVYGEPEVPIGFELVGVVGGLGPFPLADDEPRVLADTRDWPRWQVVQPWVGEHEVRSSMILPLAVHGDTYGCLAIGSSRPQVYGARHLRVAQSFAERIVQALWNARLFQLEQERARAAENLASLRHEFVATVSHELRTPLTAVLGYAEVLSGHWDRLSEAQRKANLQRIVTAANRQKRLVDDLLQVSTLDGDEMPMRRGKVSLAEIVALATDEVKASYANQSIEVAGPPDLVVVADPLRTEQVLVNLMDNAAKYSPEGSCIEVNWMREVGAAVVRVRDHGPGIPPEGREVLFTRFGRVPGSRMRAGRVGTGLGLFLGRAYTQAMGGTLELEATGPDGSVFRLCLPI